MKAKCVRCSKVMNEPFEVVMETPTSGNYFCEECYNIINPQKDLNTSGVNE